MKNPVRHESVSFVPTQRCADCGCWLRSGNHTGRCALHAKEFEARPRKIPPAHEPLPERPEPATQAE